MRALSVHEAADLCRSRIQDVDGLKASAAILMWKAILWLLGDLYPRYVIADTAVDTGGVSVGRPAVQEEQHD